MTATTSIEVGSIVTIGKARTLWEVTHVSESRTYGTTVQLVKVDGDGYVTMTRPVDAVTHQAGPCQDVALAQLIAAKDAARRAALDLADDLRLWPEEDRAWASLRAARAALEAWTAARDAHYAGRKAGNIEAAIKAARAVAA